MISKIKIIIIFVFVLQNVACSSLKFWQKPQAKYIGTLNLVMQKKESHYWINIFGSNITTYKLQITLPNGKIISGKYDDKKGKFKPGDFVEITIEENKIINVKKLSRAILDK